VGFFPTSGRYDTRAVARAVIDAGADPWPPNVRATAILR
jgi:hypothetical protein